MLLLLSAALALQAGAPLGVQDTTARAARPASADTARLAQARRDSVKAWRDSVAAARAARRHAAYASTLTPEMLRAAFASDAARQLYFKAREARVAQDSALLSYDAVSYQRISAGLGFAKMGRDRLVFRHENAARVRWSRDRGAWVEVKGSRTTMPALTGMGDAQKEVQDEMADEASPEMAPIPYFPGKEGMWIGGGLVNTDVDEHDIIHPLAEGAERWYRFSLGDSLTIRTGEGHAFTLRELRVEPRKPQWNLVVGSLWFDAGSGRLVRAVYRLADELEPFQIAKDVDGEDPKDEIPVWVRPLILPLTGGIDAVTVEYGLYENRFWLPRVQRAEGHARVSFMRVPFTYEESYRYNSVNGRLDSLPPLLSRAEQKARDDSVAQVSDSLKKVRAALKADTTAEGRRRLAAYEASRDSARAAQRRRACEDGLLTHTEEREENSVRVSVSVPCDASKLATAPELPKSPYGPGDELFTSKDLADLKSIATSLIVQPGFAPQKPTLYYGADLWRYNRVEGFSPGVAVREKLGAGYEAEAQARIGLAELHPGGELTLERAAGPRAVRLTAYHRLAAANDFGNPLGFGASVSALLFGRDEGFYYRTTGAEIAATGATNPFLTLRLFTERHGPVGKNTDIALPRLLGGHRFTDNIVAERGSLAGLGVEVQGSRGEDPEGFRLLGDLKAEGAEGTWVFGRGLADLTFSRGLGRDVVGALTTSGGVAAGEVPVQRLFYLGGSQTVRGQRAGDAIGDAFWMTRAELGGGFVAARPTLFFDAGWAGDRNDWRHPGRPLSGAGVGASFMDGLVRLDLAKGIYPRKAMQLDLYVEARF